MTGYSSDMALNKRNKSRIMLMCRRCVIDAQSHQRIDVECKHSRVCRRLRIREFALRVSKFCYCIDQHRFFQATFEDTSFFTRRLKLVLVDFSHFIFFFLNFRFSSFFIVNHRSLLFTHTERNTVKLIIELLRGKW